MAFNEDKGGALHMPSCCQGKCKLLIDRIKIMSILSSRPHKTRIGVPFTIKHCEEPCFVVHLRFWGYFFGTPFSTYFMSDWNCSSPRSRSNSFSDIHAMASFGSVSWTPR